MFDCISSLKKCDCSTILMNWYMFVHGPLNVITRTAFVRHSLAQFSHPFFIAVIFWNTLYAKETLLIKIINYCSDWNNVWVKVNMFYGIMFEFGINETWSTINLKGLHWVRFQYIQVYAHIHVTCLRVKKLAILCFIMFTFNMHCSSWHLLSVC